MSSLEYFLPKTQAGVDVDWENARIWDCSVWGNHKVKQIWGWPDENTGTLQVSDPVKNSDGDYQIIITLRDPEPVDGEGLVFIGRFQLDEQAMTGVFGTTLQECKPVAPK